MTEPLPLITGNTLATMVVRVTAQMVVGGALASRDWSPQHHDADWAKRAGLAAVIMNNPTQLGLISRYVTDRLGWRSRVLRLGCRMKAAIVPGDEIELSGMVTALDPRPGLGQLACVSVNFHREGRVVTEGRAQLGIPAPGMEALAWRAARQTWMIEEEGA